ncbi:MAG: hypothetical protein EP330_20305 [Deltaproteobacteria bacterium]|nr:MAG: hypothetical protein EP330_20305 [Deltaproteobacteria bacterium]
MMRVLPLMFLVACGLRTAPTPEDPVVPEDTGDGAGPQIGGIDCDNSRIVVTAADESGAPVAVDLRIVVPEDGEWTVACDGSCTVDVEVPAPITFGVHATASGYAPANTLVTFGADNQVGTAGEDCGDIPLFEADVALTLLPDTGEGGDIYTSNLTLGAVNSAGAPQPGELTIDSPVWGEWSTACPGTGTWIDLDGPGTYGLDYVGDNGETASTEVVIGAEDLVGINELGELVYHRELTLQLR